MNNHNSLTQKLREYNVVSGCRQSLTLAFMQTADALRSPDLLTLARPNHPIMRVYGLSTQVSGRFDLNPGVTREMRVSWKVCNCS